MKWIWVATLILTSSAFAKDLPKNTSLEHQNDFVLLSDVKESEMDVYVSYLGKASNHCGIALRLNSFSFDAAALKDIFQLGTTGVVNEFNNGRFVARIENSDINSFGANFKIKTKSGSSISDVIREMSPFNKVEVLVEILSCK